MQDKDRIFYLMNNMKAVYLNILNNKNPATYGEALDLLIKQGDVLNMNSNMSGANVTDDNMMDIDTLHVHNKEEESINLVSIDQGGRTFWVTIKEKKIFPISTSSPVARTFLEKHRMCWNCGAKDYLRKDCPATENQWDKMNNNKYKLKEGSGKEQSQE
ncbi:hypothetical protein BB561_000167 [Smittium simulii]|uniref:CCHC-type domain-containing protein n=1 Tax=Smittium simulii TaxID=133385 RepID=A0A2T9Z0F2_9FUNG|nr:hypothetical protein BB561_000167 [Smittium simulii]